MSTRTARLRTARAIDTVGVLAVVVGLVLGLLPGVALAHHGAGNPLGATDFELDGNLVVNTKHDWADIGGFADEFVQKTDGTAKGKNELDWFKASTKEQDYNKTPGWTFEEGGNADKSDLVRTFIASQLDGSNSWLWLGASRVSDNGNTQVSVEFNQSNVTSLTGSYRTAGDIYIRFNFPGQASTDTVSVGVSRWPAGQTSDKYPAPTTLPAGAFTYDLGGIEGGDTDFIELQLDLDYIFTADGGLGLGCTQFGAGSFRTESSGGTGDNNDPTLKDVVGPFPLDLNTCEEVTVKKVDEDGNPLQGAQFTLYKGSTTSGALASGTGVTNPCTTGADGTCSFGFVTPDTYTVDETVVPAGYRKDADLPYTFDFDDSLDLEFTDPRIPYTISVEPDATNALDDTNPAASEHEFTVTLSDDEGPLAGEEVDLSWSGIGSIVRVNGVDGAASTCTTKADGTCSVVVNTSDPGSGTLTGSWDTPYQNTVSSPDPLPSTTAVDDDPPTVAYPTIADDATKNWVGLDASIEATATNLLGDPHDFTVTVWEVDGVGADDGTEAGSLVSGASVQVSWSGPAGSTIDGDASSSSCVTGADGTCTVSVDSDTNGGTGTATVTSVSGTVTGGETATTTFGTDEVTAQKTWRIYRATIDDDSVNPAGQTHEFTVDVQYSDDNGLTWQNPGEGIKVDWTGPTPSGSSDLGESTCDDGTDPDGECTIVVYSAVPGSGTVTVTSVNGDLLMDEGQGEFDVPNVDATKTWLAFAVDISDPAVNLVGEDHTFRVVVSYSDGGPYEPVAAGTKVAWTDSSDSRVTADTCSTGTGDDLDTGPVETNVCFITVSSTTTGSIDITVTGVDDFQFTGRTEDVDFNTPGESSKTWIDYRAHIEADGVNLVNDNHTFTVTAERDLGDGNGWVDVADGTVVTVSASGLGATVDQSDCADGTTDGTCEVVVSSSSPGTVTITVDTVENVDAPDSPQASVDVSDGADLDEGQSASADKTWIAYRANIETSATNLTGEPHVFDVTAEQNDGTGWVDVPDGTTVSFSGASTSDTCGSTVDGACTITVDSATVGEVTITITGVSAEDVDGDPTATVANTALSANGSLSATKTWIAVRVTVEQDETNVVGEDHVFTVDVDVVTPAGTFEAPDGTTVAVSSSGAVGAIESQTCDAPGTTDGRCTVTVGSDAPGQLTIRADSVSFTWDGTEFTVDFLDGVTDGEAGGQDRTATKTWRAYRASIAPDGLNLVRDAHTFTVTLEQSDGGGEDSWGPVPDGTTATVQLSGTGSGDAGASTCATTGTVDGDCIVVVNSTSAGTLTATVTAISVDLPEEERVDISVDVTDDSASKTWIAFRGLISRDSVNITGDPHDFTLTAQYTTNGTTWTAVPDGSSIAFSSDGVGSVDDDDCGSTVGGSCTVTVVSDDHGDRTVTVTGVDPAAITVLVGGTSVERNFGLVDLDDATATGVQPGTDVEVEATKTWASYTLDLTPDRALNLLPVDPDHVFTAVLRSDNGEVAPIGGQTIDVTISSAVGTIKAVESGLVAGDKLSATCVTSDDGTCDITVTSTTPGTARIDATYDAQVGDSASVEITTEPSIKVWTTYRVTVEADAVNVVGNPHTFTVTVEQSNPAGECDADWCPVAGAFPTSEVTGTATIIDNDCVDNGTGADGTCTVTIVSDTVETVVLTASYGVSVDQFSATFTDTGGKTWVDFDLTVDPPEAENLVGTEHVFTVTITTTVPVADDPETEEVETTATLPVEGAVPEIALTGQGSIVPDGDGCAAGTNAAGQCTVTITSAAPGDSTLTATWLGTTSDDAKGKSVGDSGDKLWVDYDLQLTRDATNAVGDDHEFTATLQVNTGQGFGPAAGESLQFTVDGVGDVIGGDVDGDLACTTDSAGECRIVIVSDEGGTTTVGVTYLAEVGETSAVFPASAVKTWVQIGLEKTAVVGDGFGDGDLVEDPGSGIPTLFFTSSDRGPKTAVFEYVITNKGAGDLFNLALVDDRLGDIDLSACPAVLAPGKSCTVRASEQFTYDDAAGGLEPLIVNVAVVTASGEDGSEVFDTADAVIQLIAQQSSILIDLEKDVVVGAGDVAAPDGIPTVTWSQEEYESGASKTVRYRFTVTNVGTAPIVDVELVDPMLSSTPLISVADGVTLLPGESTVVEVDHVLTSAAAFPDGPTAGDVPNVATVSGANETRDSFDQDSDDAIVFVQVVFAEIEERPPLPATGLAAGGLAPLALLLVLIGSATLWLERRSTLRG